MHSVVDDRGTLTEIFKFPSDGQVFCLRMPAGSVRGNHYHRRKTEHFCVIEGTALIRTRERGRKYSNSYFVSGDEMEVKTVTSNKVHNLEALSDCIVLVWADEKFNKNDPDTYPEEV